MQIVVKGHHAKVQERFRRYVSEKLAKVERFADRDVALDVLISKERNPRLADVSDRVELTVRSPGPVVRAEACAQDPYAAFDCAWDKLEGRLRKLKDKRKIHRGSRAPVSVAAATAPLASALAGSTNGVARDGASWPEEPASDASEKDEDGRPIVPVEMEGDGPLVVREKSHAAGPMSIEQALFAMELVGHDFYLFRDASCGKPSVVYRRRGYDYGVIRLDEATETVA
ncbi:MAG: ribosome-associated translation inhibitor RaiA [Streptosporangiales bacterium]|nr:ribosome-associated translation inhibitor RaiA [Streptosporangiales bacterium]MBO0892427.1 ribosome-associated translation inhibitor RaiA [Acidothermales bacterium]